jgi:uncharacterized RDD family membrane protein YckC
MMNSLVDLDGKYNPYAPPAATLPLAEQPALYADAMVLAERGTRWWARVIDQLLVGMSIAPALVVVYGFNQDMGWGLCLLAAAFLGYQWYLIARTGQTLAKRWLGIKVVRMDGTSVGFVHGVILREWVTTAFAFIPLVGRLFNLVDAVTIFGQDRRCVHDQIANTKVIVALPGFTS